MGKLLLLTFNEQEEKAIDKIISTLSDHIQLETVCTVPTSSISFSL